MTTEGQCFIGEEIKAILLDVAGTTSSISFVRDTLFPYAASQAEAFLKSNWEEPAVKTAVKKLNPESDLELAVAVETFKDLTDKKSDNLGVKALQGLLYKSGYKNGDIKGHVFPDVPTALKSWSADYKVAIFSTGSTESQKLLFANTADGDLTQHINSYFDQEIGSKTDLAAYRKIADTLKIQTNEIFFITDDTIEAKAAKAAGLQATLVEREGNAQLDDAIRKEFKVITSFAEITSGPTSKRKLEEPESSESRPAKLAKPDQEDKQKEETTKETADEPMDVTEAKSDVETSEATAETKAVEEAKEEVVEKEQPSESVEKVVTDEKKVDEIKEDGEKNDTVEKKEQKPDEQPDSDVVTEKIEKEEKVEEVKVVEGEKKVEDVEEKTDVASKENEKEEKAEEPKEEKVEKENKSELANGTTEKNGDNINGKEAENGDVEKKVEEVKVKKLEEAEEKSAVAVECS